MYGIRSSHSVDSMTTEPYTIKKTFKSFAYETMLWKAVGSPKRSESEKKEIFNICSICEHQSRGRCSICHCHIYEGSSKIAWGSTSCPEGKWGPRSDLVDTVKLIHDVHDKERESNRPPPPARKSSGGCCGGRKKDG